MLDIDDIAEVIANVSKAHTAPLIARLDAAEARAAELEQCNGELVARLAAVEARKIPELPEFPEIPEIPMDEIGALITAAAKAEVAAIPLPQDGKSVDPVEVRRMVGEEVKAVVSSLPPAEKGADGIGLAGAFINRDNVLVLTLSNGETKELGVVVGKDGAHAAVEQVVEVIRPLLAEEAQKALDALPKPKDGKDVDMDEVRGIIEVTSEKAIREYVDAAMAAIPVPQDGKSVTLDDVSPLIAAEVARAVAELPKPKDGDPGVSVASAEVKDGHLILTMSDETKHDVGMVKGRDGYDVEEITVTQNGRDLEFGFTVDDVRSIFEIELPEGPSGKSVDVDEVRQFIAEGVDAAFARLQIPKDGEAGRGIADALLDSEGALILTYTDGKTKNVGVVQGKDGETFGFDDFEEELAEDGRTIVRRYKSGDTVKEFQHKFSVPDYKGVHRDGAAYEKGDMVTFGGSTWIAVRDTSAKPESSSDWKLCAKRGRDGKPGKAAGNG